MTTGDAPATGGPDEQGLLDVGDGHRVYWEATGDPRGVPVVALHGGPGGGSSPTRRRGFDPRVFRFVQLDQRGCGRSTPHASEPSTDLATNTTHHLVADLERLRVHLGIERWVVWGASWGSTLALAYAQRHPERVIGMILLSVTLTRRRDVEWFGRGAGRFFPEAWERFRAGVPAGAREGDLVAAYDRLLNGSTEQVVRERAARDWCAWEDALLSLEEGYPIPNPRWADARYRMAFARLVTHYFAHAGWLGEHELVDGAARLAGIPGVLIHGRLDVSCPAEGAWQLARAWPGAALHLVGTGHGGGPEMTARMREAIDRFGRG